MTTHRIICAGFGGQGIMSMGQLLTYAGMVEGKEVAWLPSYGPEMRGGTANCAVTVSDTQVGAPLIYRDATCVVAMNTPSMDKFEEDLIPNSIMLVNSSLVKKKATRDDIKVYYIPANDIAMELENPKVTNMIMLGAFLELTKAVEIESILKAFTKVFGEKKKHLVPLNEKAIKRGIESVK